MAIVDVDWAVTPLISVFDQARDLGFDLRKFDHQTPEIQSGMRKATIDSIVGKIRGAWLEKQADKPRPRGFREVGNGVYVISIGDRFGVRYAAGCSEVMYIGRGRFSNRFRSHLQNWIFDMSLSLRDVPFRFYMVAVGDKRSADAFKDFEHFMLEEFHDKFGEKPLINKIGGRAGTIDHEFRGNWRAPMDNRGKRYLWEIRPTEQNDWFKEIEDE